MAAQLQNQFTTKQEDGRGEPSIDEMLEPEPIEGFDNVGSMRLPNYEGDALGVQGLNPTPLIEYDQANHQRLEPGLTGKAVSEFEDILDKAEKEVIEEYDELSQSDNLIDTAAVYGSTGNMTATRGSDLEAMIVINYGKLLGGGDLMEDENNGRHPAELAGRVAAKVESYENRLPEKLTGGLDARVTTEDNLFSAIMNAEMVFDKSIPFNMGGPIKTGIAPSEVESWGQLEDQTKVGCKNDFVNFKEKMAALYKGSVIPKSYSGDALKELDEGIKIIQDDGDGLSEYINNRDEFTIERLCAQYVQKFDEPEKETKNLANYLSKSENYHLNDEEEIVEKIEEVRDDD